MLKERIQAAGAKRAAAEAAAAAPGAKKPRGEGQRDVAEVKREDPGQDAVPAAPANGVKEEAADGEADEAKVKIEVEVKVDAAAMWATMGGGGGGDDASQGDAELAALEAEEEAEAAAEVADIVGDADVDPETAARNAALVEEFREKLKEQVSLFASPSGAGFCRARAGAATRAVGSKACPLLLTRGRAIDTIHCATNACR